MMNWKLIAGLAVGAGVFVLARADIEGRKEVVSL